MDKQVKRLISSMVVAVSAATLITSIFFTSKFNERYTKHSSKYEAVQSELYNRIKLDPDYRIEYQTRLSQLQSDFFEGKINSKEYDAKLHELSKTDSLISEFLQRPDVQQEYNNEFQEMKSLKQNMHKEATRSGIPCIAGLIIGSVGLAGGAQAIVSSVDIPEDEEKNTHGI